MKVAFFLPRLHTTGGAELLALTQMDVLREAGHDVWLVTYDVTKSFESLGAAGDRLRRMRIVTRGQGEVGAILTRLLVTTDSVWVESALAEADVVVAHNFPANAILGRARIPGRKVWYCHEPLRALHREETCPRAAQLSRDVSRLGDPLARKLFVERRLHGLDRVLYGPWRRLGRVEREGVAGVGQVLCNSAFTLSAFRASYGRDDGEIVHPIVPFPARRHERALDARAPRFLCHSRLQLEKNVAGVIRAFARVRRALPGATLRVVGSGPDRPRLEALAEGVAGVSFSGFLPHDELERAYDDADAFVAVPFDEPFGMVFPEALLRGLPVVGSDHAGPLEILEGGRFGELADPADDGSIADAMQRVLSRPKDAQSEAATAMVERYGREAGGRRFLAAIEGTR